MQKEYAELFSAFTQFRKLHMSDLFPNMNHSEFATLMHIGGANKCLNEEKVKVSTLSGPQNYICGTDPGGGRGTGGSGGNNEYIYGKGTKQPEKRRRNPSDCADEPAL